VGVYGTNLNLSPSQVTLYYSPYGADALGKLTTETIDNQDLHKLISEARNGTVGIKVELHTVVGNAERIYEAQAAAVHGEDNKDVGVVAILNDITEMKNIDKMKSSFVAMASHELRTPLTSIRGSLQLLLADDEALPSEDGRELVGVALKSSERLVRIINDILDIAKIEAGQLPMSVKHVEAGPLLQTAADAVGGLAQEKRLTIDVIVDAGLPLLLLDQDRMVQSLVNLLSNAVKFSPTGGRITLRASQERIDETVLSVTDA